MRPQSLLPTWTGVWLDGIRWPETRQKVLVLRLLSFTFEPRIRRRRFGGRSRVQGRVQNRGAQPGQNASGLGSARARGLNGVSEITAGQIRSRDRRSVPWMLLFQVLTDVPHWKVVRRDVVDGEVVFIAVPNRPG